MFLPNEILDRCTRQKSGEFRVALVTIRSTYGVTLAIDDGTKITPLVTLTLDESRHLREHLANADAMPPPDERTQAYRAGDAMKNASSPKN